LCQWQGLEEWTARTREVAATQPGSITPFLLLSTPASPAEILSAATAYARTFAVPQTLPVTSNANPKLRVGYFSADFRDHVVATVISEVLERHDRADFDIVAYSYGPDDNSPQRQRIQRACGDFVDIRALSDADAARKIQADKIDILVDLNGYSGNIRHRVPMYRPAPVQINWLGYPATTGSPAMDYILADPFVIPEGAEAFYSEKVIRFTGSCQPHDRTRAVSPPLTRAAYALPETGIVFCSFNLAQKITPEIFGTWMDILRAVPDSVLWLRADRAPVMKNLRDAAAAAGIAPARLIFAPRTPDLGDHLARYHLADVALDTYPYNSHTTANDALWAGCPLVTLTGETFAARVAGGILQALKAPDLITASLAAYRDMAIHIATTPGALQGLRDRLANAKTAPHFDTDQFVRHLEAAYREAWRIFAAGQKPTPFTVGA
jgi:protein O-GlcNAc transferase